MGQYEQIMERIEVTGEMRSRILRSIQSADLTPAGKSVRFPRRWRSLSIAACLALLILGAVALPDLIQKSAQPDPPLLVTPNLVECTTLAALEEQVGFPVSDVQGLPFDVESSEYLAYGSELAQITYSGEGQTAVYRKSAGSKDNSGDYTIYDTQTSLKAGSLTASLKGSGGSYCLALWADQGYAYSLRLSDGLTEAEWTALLSTD